MEEGETSRNPSRGGGNYRNPELRKVKLVGIRRREGGKLSEIQGEGGVGAQ